MKRYLESIFDNVRVIKDVTYVNGKDRNTGNEFSLKADFYMPDGDAEANRRTLIIIHGGGFVDCTKTQSYVVTLCEEFAKLGYVCVSPDYHLHDKENRPSYKKAALNTVPDIETLRLYLLLHANEYGIDPSNMAVCGGSAGGMLANELCKIPGAYRALVSLWGAPEEITEPGNYTPALLVHGTADKLVLYELSVKLLETLKANNVHAELITLEGAPHTAIDRKDEFVPRIITFLDEYMK